ncbi:hypothetical protein KAW08_03950 [bacterium]|nr:hypothetical protein [bacterium]
MILRKTLIILFFICAVIVSLQSMAQVAAPFSQAKLPSCKYVSKHFIVYSYSREKAAYLAKKAEVVAGRVIGHSGVSRFASWKTKAIIVLYKTHSEYVKETGQPGWSGGSVGIVTHGPLTHRVIYLYEGAPNLFSNILPHEITHLVFMQIMGPKASIPLWLNEGLAVYEQKDKGKNLKIIAARNMNKNNDIKLDALIKYEKAPEGKPELFYGASAGLVEYLFVVLRRPYYVKMISLLKQGASSYEAFRGAYGKAFKSFPSMEKCWKKYMIKKYCK